MKNEEKDPNINPPTHVIGGGRTPLCSCCFKHAAEPVSPLNPEGLCFKCRTTGCPERFACRPQKCSNGRAWRNWIGMKKILRTDEEDTFHDD